MKLYRIVINNTNGNEIYNKIFKAKSENQAIKELLIQGVILCIGDNIKIEEV